MFKEYLVVFGWGFIPTSLWLWYDMLKYAWTDRWNQKFKGPMPEDSNWDEDMFHDSDLEAFAYRVYEHATNKWRWSVIIATPFVVGLIVSMVFWLIYYTVEVV